MRLEVLELVESALSRRHAGEGPAQGEETTEVARTLDNFLGAGTARVPGTPAIPHRGVQGIKADTPVGRTHAILAMDPMLPESLWVTKCGWHFAQSEHVILEDGEAITRKLCRRGPAGGAAGAGRKRGRDM